MRPVWAEEGLGPDLQLGMSDSVLLRYLLSLPPHPPIYLPGTEI